MIGTFCQMAFERPRPSRKLCQFTCHAGCSSTFLEFSKKKRQLGNSKSWNSSSQRLSCLAWWTPSCVTQPKIQFRLEMWKASGRSGRSQWSRRLSGVPLSTWKCCFGTCLQIIQILMVYDSNKNRKPIGEVGWWSHWFQGMDRWGLLSFSLFLFLWLSTYQAFYCYWYVLYLSIYLPIYLSIYLSIYHACPLEKYGGWRGCFSFGGTVQFIEESSIYLCFVVYRLKRGLVTWPNLRVIKRRISYPCSSRTLVPLFRGRGSVVFFWGVRGFGGAEKRFPLITCAGSHMAWNTIYCKTSIISEIITI